MNSIADRIKHLYEIELKVTQIEFASKVNVGASTISNIVKNNRSPNFSLIDRILEQYPSLSTDWLCRGIGPIWKEENQAIYIPVYKDNSGEKEELLDMNILISRFKKMETKIQKIESEVFKKEE